MFRCRLGHTNHRAGPYFAVAAALPVVLALTNAFGVVPHASAPSTKPNAVTDSTKELDRQFHSAVLPFLGTYCIPCHGKENPDAQLNLTAYSNVASVMEDDTHWARILDKVASNQMPPSHASKQPLQAQRDAVIAWIHAVQQYEAGHRKDTGDPGPVLARRLSNAEYNYTVRDLTGVDLQPAREFPVDAANQEGFDNSGESLTMSSALMKKYVQAAKDSRRPHGADLDRYRVCHAPGSGGNRPRQILHSCASSIFTSISRPTMPTISWRRGVTATAPRWVHAERATLADRLRRIRKVSPALPCARLGHAHHLPLPRGADRKAPGKVECAARRRHPGYRQGAGLMRRGRAAPSMRDWVQGLRKKVAWKFDNLPVPNVDSRSADSASCSTRTASMRHAPHAAEPKSDCIPMDPQAGTQTANRQRLQKIPWTPIRSIPQNTI